MSNHGPTAANDVRVIDQLPSSVELVSINSDTLTCAGEQTITCSLDQIVSGENHVIVIEVLPTKAERIRNKVFVSSVTFDPDEDNNEDKIRTRVRK